MKLGVQAPCQAVIESPIAGGRTRIAIHCEGGAVQALALVTDDVPLVAPANPTARKVVKELQAYFTQPRSRFSVPLQLQGTVFQQRVWHALQGIPWGTTRSYGEIARRLHTSARAVGNACRDNPVPLLVPCHRVVAAHGPGGFMGSTRGTAMDIKDWLLRHEQGE